MARIEPPTEEWLKYQREQTQLPREQLTRRWYAQAAAQAIYDENCDLREILRTVIEELL